MAKKQKQLTWVYFSMPAMVVLKQTFFLLLLSLFVYQSCFQADYYKSKRVYIFYLLSISTAARSQWLTTYQSKNIVSRIFIVIGKRVNVEKKKSATDMGRELCKCLHLDCRWESILQEHKFLQDFLRFKITESGPEDQIW